MLPVTLFLLFGITTFTELNDQSTYTNTRHYGTD